jgi:hypothetical protein
MVSGAKKMCCARINAAKKNNLSGFLYTSNYAGYLDVSLRAALLMEGDVPRGGYSRRIHSKDWKIIWMVRPQQSKFWNGYHSGRPRRIQCGLRVGSAVRRRLATVAENSLNRRTAALRFCELSAQVLCRVPCINQDTVHECCSSLPAEMNLTFTNTVCSSTMI